MGGERSTLKHDQTNSMVVLANPRELFAGEHVHHAGAADAGFHGDHPGVILNHAANDPGMASERMRAHGGERIPSVLFRNYGIELAFVGDVQRVQAEHFAGGFDFLDVLSPWQPGG